MKHSTMENQTIESTLTQPEVERALLALVERLPKIEQSLRRLEDAADFGAAVMRDEQVKRKIDSFLDQSNLQIETLEAAMQLLEKLPMLLNVVNQLENVAAFAQDVYQDEASKAMIGQRIDEYVTPLKQRADWTRDTWTEVRRRAEGDERQVTLFSLIRWLKEPSVQHGLKYMQATIEVLSEDSTKR